MLLQTNSYIVPKERRAEHARLIRRFRQALARIGCDQFEVYEQVGANWSPGGANGRYVQIMRFRDRQHQQAVQAAEREDHGAQHIIAEFCELINFPYQQQHGYFATGFYTSVLPVGPRQAIDAPPVEEDVDAPIAAEAGGFSEEEIAAEAEQSGEWQEDAEGEPAETPAEQAHDAEVADEFLDETESAAPAAVDADEEAALAATLPETTPEEWEAASESGSSTSPLEMTTEEAEAALLDDKTPHQIAPEGVVADAFLDSLSEADLPAEELGGLEPSAHAPGEAAEDDEMNFAEAPIANAPLEAATAEGELVTADTLADHNAAPSADAQKPELEVGEFDLDDLELSELGSEEMESLEPLPGEPEPAQPVSAELQPAEAETLELAGHQTSKDTAAELHEDVLGDLGLDFGEEEPAATPVAENHADHAAEIAAPAAEVPMHSAEVATPAPEVETPAAQAEELGLDFEEFTPESALDPAPAQQPLIEEAALVDETPLEPVAETPAIAAAPSDETPVDEFELDEGLIFDDDEIPAETHLAEASLPPLNEPPASGENGSAHGHSREAILPEDGMDLAGHEPTSHEAALPDEPDFDALLDDPNLLANAPTFEHGENAPATHTETGGVEDANTPGEKDADLLEFDAFLRQLDQEHEHHKK